MKTYARFYVHHEDNSTKTHRNTMPFKDLEDNEIQIL